MSKFGKDLIESLTDAVVHARGEKPTVRANRRKPQKLNPEMIKTMQAAQRGELVTVGKPENLLASLNADDIKIEQGSGNVFADLGLPDAEERLAEAERRLKRRPRKV